MKMSEGSPAVFNEGDIVWVKLGPSWWPGEVKNLNSLPEDVANFKKPPLVIVKFFDEDSYEYVRNWSNIYPYNSSKKAEFIKKGMVAHMAKLSHMEKFPKDVLNAEMRIGGNLNILNEPQYQPEKKRNIVAEIFGTPSPKIKKNKSPSKTPRESGVITHRRFLGSKNLDDYRAYICIQYPGKDRVPGDQEEEEVIRINREPEEEYNCHSCSFTTRRLEVMIWHSKSHIQGVYVSSPKKYKRPSLPKQKKERSNSEGSKEKRRRTQSPKKPATITSKEAEMSKKPNQSEPQPSTSNSTRHELLAEWDDSDENEDIIAGPSNAFNNKTQESTDVTGDLIDGTQEATDVKHKSRDITRESSDVTPESTDVTLESTDVTHESTDITQSSSGISQRSSHVNEDKPKDMSSIVKLDETLNSTNSEHENREIIEEEPLVGPLKSKKQLEISKPSVESEEPKSTKQNMDIITREAIKSCFDFDEEEEEPLVTTAVSGRKIPRVIPRKKSNDVAFEDEGLKRDEILNSSSSYSKIILDKNKEHDDIAMAFREIMETTALPELPDVQNTLKCEQNFHNIETIKFPDKPLDAGGSSPPKLCAKEKNESSEIATKLTNPKKRFVKSFEDFELMQNQIRRKEEIKYDESLENQEVVAVELKDNDHGEMPSKNVPLAEVSPKANKFSEVLPSKSSDGTSATIGVHDDFENNDEETEILKFANLKTKIMSKIMEEAKMNEESKNRIMSLMTGNKSPTDTSTKKHSHSRSRKDVGIHRTPRSKILELYHDQNSECVPTSENNQNSLETEVSTEVLPLRIEESSKKTVDVGNTKEEEKIVPPNKNKWSRRGSHPKKDRKIIIEESKKEPEIIQEKRYDSHIIESTIITMNKDESAVVHTIEPSETVDSLKNGDKNLPKDFDNIEVISSKQSTVCDKNIPHVEQLDILNIQNPSSKDETSKQVFEAQSSLTHSISMENKELRRHHLQEITVDIAPEKATDDEMFKEYSFPSSGVDDFSPIGHASPALPENAICLPPKKSKKRKHSKAVEETLWSNKIPDNSLEFSQKEEGTLSEKRKRSLDDTEIRNSEDPKNIEPTIIPAIANISEPGVNPDIIDQKGEVNNDFTLEQTQHQVIQEGTDDFQNDIKMGDLTDIEDISASQKRGTDKDGLMEDIHQNDSKGLAAERIRNDNNVLQISGSTEEVGIRDNSEFTEDSKQYISQATTNLQITDDTLCSPKINSEEQVIKSPLDNDIPQPQNEEIVLVQERIMGDFPEELDQSKFIAQEANSQLGEHMLDIVANQNQCGHHEASVKTSNEIVDEQTVTESDDIPDIVTECTVEPENVNVIPNSETIADVSANAEIDAEIVAAPEIVTEIVAAPEIVTEITTNFESGTEFIAVPKIIPEDTADSQTAIECSESELVTDIDTTSETITEFTTKLGSIAKPLTNFETVTEIVADPHASTDIITDPHISTEMVGDPYTTTEIVADPHTTTDIADPHTVTEIISDIPTVTGDTVDSKTVTEIIADSDTVTEIIADSETVTEVIADSETATEIIADSETATEIIADSETVSEIITDPTTISQNVSDMEIIHQSACEIVTDSGIITETILEVETINKSDHISKNEKTLVHNKVVDVAEKESSGHSQKETRDDPEIGSVDVTASTDEATPDEATPDETVVEHHNKLEIQCGSMSDDVFKFSIQTNLSNFSSREELSAIALATLAEIKSDSDSNTSEEVLQEKPGKDSNFSEKASPSKPELVPIEGNLTVVSEKDLADGQVEITPKQIISTKKPVMLSNFSMDFSDSTSDSTSTNEALSEQTKFEDFDSKGTEFTSNAMTREIKPKVENKKGNTYERFELLDILEGNSDAEKKGRQRQVATKSFMDDICDFEEHIPSQIVCAKKLRQDMENELKMGKEKNKSRKSLIMSTTSKLLERLTEAKVKGKVIENTDSDVTSQKDLGSNLLSTSTKTMKTVSQSKICTGLNTTKPIILPEQTIKPVPEASKQSNKSKKLLNDIEDVEAFVIHKDMKKHNVNEEPEKISQKPSKISSKSGKGLTKISGKAKILQHSIITPAGEILQPTVGTPQTDDNIFDINSMPIVLSDEILTPESIEKMPIVIGSDTTGNKTIPQENLLVTTAGSKPVVKKVGKVTTTTSMLVGPSLTLKTPSTTTKITKVPRILQSVGSKSIKQSSLLSGVGKPGKYIILPQSAGLPTGKIITKKTPVIKRTPPSTIISKLPSVTPEPSGNKIMIFTNQQGQQQRLLLTPAQQKMLGYQTANSKITKTVVKGNVLQKSVLTAKGVSSAEAGTSGITPKPSIVGQKVVITTNPSPTLMLNTGQHVISGISPQIKNIKGVTKKAQTITHQKFAGNTSNKPQKTILITTKQGQPVRKIQGTEEDLEKQVAEQLEAIRASSGMKFGSLTKTAENTNYKQLQKTPKRTFSRKPEIKFKSGPPSLVEIQSSPKAEVSTATVATTTSRVESSQPQAEIKSTLLSTEAKVKPDRPLNQLVIQDAVGNQTTITEGQILALPSETVDGQPQSYMLVTLDESGNLTPLNNEALMSLDPNLGLGGDLSNMVLQIDQSALTGSVVERLPLAQPAIVKTNEVVQHHTPKINQISTSVPTSTVSVPQIPVTTETIVSTSEQKVPELLPISEPATGIPSIVPSSNGEPSQQLIVTGDPIATQKFLESLSEGTTDLANILANADGNSILIQADGQQILINTNSDNQMLMSVNSDNVNVSENTEGGGNPIFATQPSKNQDILAAALADTDVFQSDQHTHSKITSQLSPNNTLYPMNVGNVLETSLTLSSPIMTPLEVPSTNNKKIPDDEADILTQVPKNVDLPITITDPNISQTVANQQVASLIANELHANLDLGLSISESTISTVSTDINSPSYAYSLPTLDDTVDISHKPFNSSMPLLNEDVEEVVEISKNIDDERTLIDDNLKDTLQLNKDNVSSSLSSKKPEDSINSGGSFLEDEGRFTLGGEMCSSLSEPPPEMFDLPETTSDPPSDSLLKDGDVTDPSIQAESSNDGSCEIPLQPQIVTKSGEFSQNSDMLKRNFEDTEENERKKCKFD